MNSNTTTDFYKLPWTGCVVGSLAALRCSDAFIDQQEFAHAHHLINDTLPALVKSLARIDHKLAADDNWFNLDNHQHQVHFQVLSEPACEIVPSLVLEPSFVCEPFTGLMLEPCSTLMTAPYYSHSTVHCSAAQPQHCTNCACHIKTVTSSQSAAASANQATSAWPAKSSHKSDCASAAVTATAAAITSQAAGVATCVAHEAHDCQLGTPVELVNAVATELATDLSLAKGHDDKLSMPSEGSEGRAELELAQAISAFDKFVMPSTELDYPCECLTYRELKELMSSAQPACAPQSQALAALNDQSKASLLNRLQHMATQGLFDWDYDEPHRSDLLSPSTQSNDTTVLSSATAQPSTKPAMRASTACSNSNADYGLVDTSLSSNGVATDGIATNSLAANL